MDVIIFVHDARMNVAFTSISSVGDFGPKAF
jgi:hypothetical protein